MKVSADVAGYNRTCTHDELELVITATCDACDANNSGWQPVISALPLSNNLHGIRIIPPGTADTVSGGRGWRRSKMKQTV